MRYALAMLLLIAGCGPLAAPASPTNYLPRIAVAIGVAEASSVTPQPQPEPTPRPQPGKCSNCGGTGKLGDGTVAVDCPVCGGDGFASTLIVPITVAALPPHGGGTGAGWMTQQLPPADAPVSPKPAAATTPQTAPPAVKPKPVVKQSLTTAGHYEWRTRKVCKGGKCVTERYRVFVPDKPAKRVGYPLRGNWWSHPPDLKAHLMRTHGYSAAYVNSLSHAELESLHSDTHEGRVRR